MYSKEMNFMTLQRPTYEELERRRQLRDTMSPQKSTTLQRRESMLSRGFNAIMRRQSFMSPNSRNGPKLSRNDSFFMHSSCAKPDELPPGGVMTNDHDLDQDLRHPLHTIVGRDQNQNRDQMRGRNLSRAKSFKYPEKISQIPPAEFTRLRSKSQIRDSGFGSSIFSKDVSSQQLSSGEDTAVYTSGSGGSAVGSGKSMKNLNSRYFEDSNPVPNWLSRERFFQPPIRKPVHPKIPARDISEPPPHTTKKRMPLPDIFYYGDRWQEQENREVRRNPSQLHRENPNRENHQEIRRVSTFREPQRENLNREMPEPPPGSDLVANIANNR